MSDNDDHDEFIHHDENPMIFSKNKYVYDDEEVNLNEFSQSVSDSIYDDISKLRKGKQRSAKSASATGAAIVPQAAPATPVNTNFLNLSKSGWDVKKIEQGNMSEFPALAFVEPAKNHRSSFGPAAKWKPITGEIFKEEEPRREDQRREEPRRDDQRREENVRERFPNRERQARTRPQQQHGAAVASQPIEKSEEFKYTRMCVFAKTCKRSNCSFAHSIEQFNPVECRFQDRCKTKETCRFRHASETKEQFLARSVKLG